MTRISTEDIYAAARSCISDFGLAKTTITDIANRAGVSRMTIYRRWKNSDDLVLDMLTHDVSRALAAASAKVSARTNARKRLIQVSLETLRTLGSDPVFRSLRSHDNALLSPYVLERTGSAQKVMIESMETMLEAGMKDGSIRRLPITEATYMLVFTMQIFVFSFDVIEHESNIDGVVKELETALERYLRP